ncbi:hypothetical protein FRB91_002824 [Serendipita sp. 411]|nr:hypothetical protein FRC18_000766 [Serendipita sp. 400]KAG8860474.1 hypothetical protein FRB91_002824 [Serendipita sp. 411]
MRPNFLLFFASLSFVATSYASVIPGQSQTVSLSTLVQNAKFQLPSGIQGDKLERDVKGLLFSPDSHAEVIVTLAKVHDRGPLSATVKDEPTKVDVTIKGLLLEVK